MAKAASYKVWMLVLVMLSTLLLTVALTNSIAAKNIRSNGEHQIYLPVVITEAQGLPLHYMGTVSQPTDIIESPHGLLVSEATGRIVNLNDNTLFLDLTSRDETIGLQSLAYHGNQLYTTYVVLGAQRIKHVSRFSIDGNVADPDSEEIIFTYLFPPNAVHVGGDMSFGPDGYLTFSLGDGSPQGDPDRHAQDKSNLFGSVVRIDVKGAGLAPDCGGTGNYTIPADNPFSDGIGGDCDELWAVGLRQPWRISFDHQEGDLWISDVGLNQREEINFQPAASPGGENYGWNCYEGSLPFLPGNCDEIYQFPIYEYEYSFEKKCSVIGGFVYRGSTMPALAGQYVFGDYCSGEIYSFDRSNDKSNTLTRVNGALWSTFGEGLDGELMRLILAAAMSTASAVRRNCSSAA